MSYTIVEENETALCLLKISGATNEVMLPENILPHLFTTLAWDNIDQIEETLTGEGTTHRVNGIIVQPKTFGPEPNKPLRPAVQKDKKRSLILDAEDLLSVYVPDKCTGPPNLQSVDLHISEVTNKVHKKNLVRMLTRQVHIENQQVMGWTGLNIVIIKDLTVRKDKIGYLPTINAHATEMTTVHEILRQSVLICNNLGVSKIVVVFDQAIYAKTVEIIWKHPDKFKYVILRMGAFHIMCNLISIIGKWFQDSGFKSIIIEAGIVVQGSVVATQRMH